MLPEETSLAPPLERECNPRLADASSPCGLQIFLCSGLMLLLHRLMSYRDYERESYKILRGMEERMQVRDYRPSSANSRAGPTASSLSLPQRSEQKLAEVLEAVNSPSALAGKSSMRRVVPDPFEYPEGGGVVAAGWHLPGTEAERSWEPRHLAGAPESSKVPWAPLVP